MRLVLGLVLVALAGSAGADTILARSQITAVTVYPNGAKITREVVFDAPLGRHEVIVTDLPAGTEPRGLQIAAEAGLTVGATSLRNDRLPARDEPKSDAVLAAEAERDAARLGVQSAMAGVEAITARVDAAQAQIGFLRSVGPSLTVADADSLQTTAAMIGRETLAASQTALAAKAELPVAQLAVTKAQEALDKTEAALAALSRGDKDYAALVVSVGQAQAGAAKLTVTHYSENATWAPVYDLSLDQTAGTLTMDRAMLVSQATGEDWADVLLTLSTAQPGKATDPSLLWPWLRRIADPEPMTTARMAEADGMGGLAEPIMEKGVLVRDAMTVSFQGDTVTYTYPDPVDVAGGVENLRLALDQLVFDPKVQAFAVPASDTTAFLTAQFVNTSGQILLPGQVFLTRDGAFIGGGNFEILAPGAKATLGFGAIEGLRLKRTTPDRSEGDRGVFSKSNQIEETAVLEVENLTDKAWDVRVLDQVPYSVQEELEITYSATPPVTEANVNGLRGVLAWEITVPAGAKSEVVLSSKLSWPEGKVLQ